MTPCLTGYPALKIVHAERDHKRQKWWSHAIGKRVIRELLENPETSARDQARLLEQSNGLGTSFMCVPPSSALQNIIPADTYRVGLKWWLGMELVDTLDRP